MRRRRVAEGPEESRLRTIVVDYTDASGREQVHLSRPVAIIRYDISAVIESAFDLIREIEREAESAAGEAFVAAVAKRERRGIEEIRAEFMRHMRYGMAGAHAHVRDVTNETFEDLVKEAFIMTGGFLAALAMDRMPDVFGADMRREARDRAVDHVERTVRRWLNVGRPKRQPPMPEEASEFVRLVAAGCQLFANLRKPVDARALTDVEGSSARISTSNGSVKRRWKWSRPFAGGISWARTFSRRSSRYGSRRAGWE